MFGMLMSLHIASFMTGKVLGSLLTTAFGVTSANFTNLAPLVLVSHLRRLPIIYSSHCTALTLPNILQDSHCSYRQAAAIAVQAATVLHYYHYMYTTCSQPGMVP